MLEIKDLDVVEILSEDAVASKFAKEEICGLVIEYLVCGEVMSEVAVSSNFFDEIIEKVLDESFAKAYDEFFIQETPVEEFVVQTTDDIVSFEVFKEQAIQLELALVISTSSYVTEQYVPIIPT